MSASTRRRVVVVLAAAVAVTAAVVVIARQSPNPAAGPTSPATSTAPATPTSVQAAQSTGFPDMDAFTDVSRDHGVSEHYPLATFTSPTGLQCTMSSNRGGTSAACYGAIPGLDRPANQVFADDYGARFDQGAPPGDAAKFDGKPLASGEKVVLGAGGTLLGGDQITCGVQDSLVACVVISGFDENRGDDAARRHGFVLSPQESRTF